MNIFLTTIVYYICRKWIPDEQNDTKRGDCIKSSIVLSIVFNFTSSTLITKKLFLIIIIIFFFIIIIIVPSMYKTNCYFSIYQSSQKYAVEKKMLISCDIFFVLQRIYFKTQLQLDIIINQVTKCKCKYFE